MPDIKDERSESAMSILTRFHDEITYYFNSRGKSGDVKADKIAGIIFHELLDHLEANRLGDPRRKSKT